MGWGLLGRLRPCVTCGEWLAWLLVDVWYGRDVTDGAGASGRGRRSRWSGCWKVAGALPVVAEFGRRLRIAEIVDELCPVRPVAWITHGEVIEALVANRLTAPVLMVRVHEWAAAMAVEEAYGIAPELLNDTGSPGRWTRLRRSWTRSWAGWGRRRSPGSVLTCPGCTGT